MIATDINTVPALAKRARSEGLPISEFTIRRLVKQGAIPARYIGRKALVSYTALVRYLSCEETRDNGPALSVTGIGIRRIGAG